MADAFFLGLGLGGIVAGGCAWIATKRVKSLARRREQDLIERLNHATRAAALAAREAEAAEALIEGLPTPLFLIDRGHRVLRSNGAGDLLVGKEMTQRDLTAGFRQPGLIAAVDKAIDQAEGQEYNLELAVPIERSFFVRIEPLPPSYVKDAMVDLSAPAALMILLDVTAITQTERMRADFVANVSHELRTPLSSLIGFIETLRGPAKDDTDAREKFLIIMQEQADRMYRLIADLLSLSRIEMEEHSAPRDPINLQEVLQKISDSLSMKARELEMTIRISNDGTPPPVTGDEDQLLQVFQNLIDNALKYGGRGNEVLVRTEVDRDWVSVTVQDFGQGIAREHLPRLTERFYRVDAARSREIGGTGLGLAIVKHIVSRHRGRFTIHSEVGEGSAFKVTLPVHRMKAL